MDFLSAGRAFDKIPQKQDRKIRPGTNDMAGATDEQLEGALTKSLEEDGG